MGKDGGVDVAVSVGNGTGVWEAVAVAEGVAVASDCFTTVAVFSGVNCVSAEMERSGVDDILAMFESAVAGVVDETFVGVGGLVGVAVGISRVGKGDGDTGSACSKPSCGERDSAVGANVGSGLSEAKREQARSIKLKTIKYRTGKSRRAIKRDYSNPWQSLTYHHTGNTIPYETAHINSSRPPGLIRPNI